MTFALGVVVGILATHGFYWAWSQYDLWKAHHCDCWKKRGKCPKTCNCWCHVY